LPLALIGGPVPPYNSVEALNQIYYSDCLQQLIEAMEACLLQGLELPKGYEIRLDLDGLLRMDTKSQAEVDEIKTRAGIQAPNEGRKKYGLPPVTGGNSPYLQQQNFSLEALAKRDAQQDPFAKSSEAKEIDSMRAQLATIMGLKEVADALKMPRRILSAMRERYIYLRWTCSDSVYHEHRYKWTAWLCGVMQNVLDLFRQRT
jgi:hypothetical protein